MQKRGLQYLYYVLGLLIIAAVLAGCGSGSNNDAASNLAMGTDTAGSEESTDGGSAQSASSSEALAKPASGEAADLNSTQPAEAGGGNASVKGPDTNQAAEGAAGFTGSDVVAGLNKKLIYHASLTMEVQDYGAAQTEVRNMVTLANGYIIEFSENTSDYEQGGTFILKVPASGFSSFLDSLEHIKYEKLQRSIQGQDVSEEYVDLESRLKAKQLMESQYIEFMKNATKSADLVAFANQLGAIQEEIETIKGRMRYIDQNVSFSTVELRLYQTDESVDLAKAKEQGPLLGRASDALQSSLHALSVMFQWLFIFLAGAFPVLIVAALAVGIVLWFRRRAKLRNDGLIGHIRGTNRGHNRELAQKAAEEQVTGDSAGEAQDKKPE
ncbi:DUF4349 domain-containing protein [Paenibacillus sp. S150]|uniref:DUF4349 domain-containing protein n=1 Tax=Paenibacillus sp. S150 TaxID=2749826 RepID=UPI001C56384A|nr:DUF4349 domain-containing protein [Paenibacillus sp. S150]MBW4081870.1 DUF4349 domain-containing protein [Paenibacillus sp. S150]